MDIDKVSAGKNPPWQVNAIIEVPMNSDPVKYELDKDSGALVVDRFLHTAMYYPCNYGFIPHTLSDDGDPIDVLVVNRQPVQPGCVMAVRPIGVLVMSDEEGEDEKLLAAPVDKLDPYFAGVKSYKDMPKPYLDQIAHFFQHYKDLEKEKWVKIERWGEADEAAQMIDAAIQRAQSKAAE
ncbi:inorganic pyrophosphatase [Rhodovibrio sodomensis]|uniref:Inorganic pyrophosphatase n=1 Tax=Rhodovibrio sodomensis TaxID=1088 RepID=A0ABS1DCE1_9PROT|nr:inorganic pyrophosphatase [Rhodovibrio sodomensis]